MVRRHPDMPQWALNLADDIERLETERGLPVHSKNNLPKAGSSNHLILVADATGGRVPAYSDKTNWRRVTDGTIVS